MSKHRFSETLHGSAAVLAEAAYEEIQHKSPLYGEEQKARIEHEIENHANHMRKNLLHGIEACIHALGESPEANAIKKELMTAFGQMNTEEDLVQAGKALLNNVTWKEQLNISNECMVALYEGAKGLLEKKDFSYAEKAFLFLATVDPTQYAFWAGLGHASRSQKHYEQAINAYAMASAINPKDYWPHVWAGATFSEQKDKTHAKMAFEEALVLAEADTSCDKELIRSIRQKIAVSTTK